MNRLLTMLMAGALAVGLGACNRAEDPAETQADVHGLDLERLDGAPVARQGAVVEDAQPASGAKRLARRLAGPEEQQQQHQQGGSHGRLESHASRAVSHCR